MGSELADQGHTCTRRDGVALGLTLDVKLICGQTQNSTGMSVYMCAHFAHLNQCGLVFLTLADDIYLLFKCFDNLHVVAFISEQVVACLKNMFIAR